MTNGELMISTIESVMGIKFDDSFGWKEFEHDVVIAFDGSWWRKERTMTREEAIHFLSSDSYMRMRADKDELEALDMAIESLQIEVVRCKDCRQKHIGGSVTHYYWCDLWDREVDGDNYCSWAERREE